MTDPNERFEAIGDQLRAKIGSKVQASTFLAGFTTSLLGIDISMLWQNGDVPTGLPLGVSALIFSLILFVCAVIRLDGLTMPKRFWPHGSLAVQADAGVLAYLSDRDLWALQKRMVFLWTRLVVAGMYITGLSLLTLLVPVESAQSLEMVAWTGVGSLVAITAVVVYIHFFADEEEQGFEKMERPAD